MASAAPLLIVSALILSCGGRAGAQTWNGSMSDLWGTAGNWTPNTVPNSSTASVVITTTTNNPVLINISPTIPNLTLGASNTLTLNDNQSLTLAGGTGASAISIAGTLNLGSGGDNADQILGGTTGSTITLSGGGTLALSNRFQNRIYSTTVDTLVNSSGNTIQGSGQFGIGASGDAFTFNSAGIVNANQSTALAINTGTTTTNTGTLEATTGGTLNLTGAYTNTGGTILATGSGAVAPSRVPSPTRARSRRARGATTPTWSSAEP
jgi:autotransporter family porin